MHARQGLDLGICRERAGILCLEAPQADEGAYPLGTRALDLLGRIGSRRAVIVDAKLGGSGGPGGDAQAETDDEGKPALQGVTFSRSAGDHRLQTTRYCQDLDAQVALPWTISMAAVKTSGRCGAGGGPVNRQ
jgi:hypothetical protein